MFLLTYKPIPSSFYNSAKISVLTFCFMIHRSITEHLPKIG